MARGAVQVVAGAAGMLLAGLAMPLRGADGKRRLVRHMLGTAGGLGKLVWWRKLPLYHVEKAPG